MADSYSGISALLLLDQNTHQRLPYYVAPPADNHMFAFRIMSAANQQFLNKAPAHVVEKLRTHLAELGILRQKMSDQLGERNGLE